MENILPKSMHANNYNELCTELKRRGGLVSLDEAKRRKIKVERKWEKGTLQEQRDWQEFKRLKKLNIPLNEYNEWFKKKDLKNAILTKKQIELKEINNEFIPMGQSPDDWSNEILDTKENCKLRLI